MNIVAIIPARGGSKGIPKKNIINFCGKPLIYWSIKNALNCYKINSVWVTSDDDEILSLSTKYGAKSIKRPDNLSHSKSSSESAWIHAINEIEKKEKIDLVVAMQATSPIRESKDLTNAINMMIDGKYDSLFSSSIIRDRFIWEKNNNKFIPSNYDMNNRKPRQLIKEKYLENGSFWIFTPELIKRKSNRLGGKIGNYIMEFYKSFQIDDPEDVLLCQSIMRTFLLKSI